MKATSLSIHLLLLLNMLCQPLMAFVPLLPRENGFGSGSSRLPSIRPAKTSLFYTPPLGDHVNLDSIRYLGKGANALVRPGVVLIAPIHEYNHFLMKAAIYVFGMGVDATDEQVIRCVVLDNPTPFTMGEMASLEGHLSQNLLYRGGNVGGESALLLHSAELGEQEEIGTSGIYQGGLEQANASTDTSTERFKFFFNYCEFSPTEMENMLESLDSDTGDGWVSVEVPPEIVLHDWDKNDCWRFLRNNVRDKANQTVETPIEDE